MNILMVCVGNICRSPMAEYSLKYLLSSADKKHNISSAGLNALVGYPAHEMTRKLLLNKKIDCSAHKARQLSSDIVISSDLVIVMESSHKYYIENNFTSSCGKVFLLGEWGGCFEVPDPFNKSLDFFIETQRLIEKGLQFWLKKL